MEENNVLDDLREEQPPSPGHYRRSVRFLLYAGGILLVLGGRLIFLLYLTAPSGPTDFKEWQVAQLFLIGVAGVWLFSGLGLVSIYRARQERPTDLIFALVTIAHLGIFILSCVYLIRGFRLLFS